MSTYCRVEVSILDVVAIRRAEPGMSLEQPAVDRDGNPIIEAGNDLDETMIDRLQRLDVRKIVVSRPAEEWIPQDKARSMTVDILETQTFDEAAGAIVEDIQTADTIGDLRQTARFLRQQAQRSGDQTAVNRINDILERANALDERISSLTRMLEDVEDEEDRERLKQALDETVRELKDLYVEVNVSNSLLNETVETAQEKNQLKNDLMAYVSDYHDELKTVDSIEVDPVQPDDNLMQALIEKPTKTVQVIREKYDCDSDHPLQTLDDAIEQFRSKKQSLKQDLSDSDVDPETRQWLTEVINGSAMTTLTNLTTSDCPQKLAQQIHEFSKKEHSLFKQLYDASEDVLETDIATLMGEDEFVQSARATQAPSVQAVEITESHGELTVESLHAVLDEIQSDDPVEAARILQDQLTESPEIQSAVAQLKSDLESTLDQNDTIRATIDESAESAEAINRMVETGNLDPDRLMQDEGLSQSEKNTIADYVNTLNSLQSDLMDQVNAATDGALRDGSVDNEVLNDAIDQASRTNTSIPPSSNEDESDDRQHDEDEPGDLQQLLADGDAYDIAQQTGLDQSIVESAQLVLERPGELSNEQSLYVQPLLKTVERMFYDRTLSESRVRSAAGELADVMVDHQSPLSMMVDVPREDRYIQAHAVNVAIITSALANAFSYDEQQLLDLTVSGLGLDLGMIQIPHNLWGDNDELSSRADREVKKHPEHSSRWIEENDTVDGTVQSLTHQHHETPDGTGYPQGLSDDTLHSDAPILQTVDSYTAMLEDRPYRDGMNPTTAMKILMNNTDEYDKGVVKSLVAMIGLYPNGSLVKLDNGQLGVVQSQTDSPLNPRLAVITDADQNRLNSPDSLDLTTEDCSIEKNLRMTG